jgi:CID domain
MAATSPAFDVADFEKRLLALKDTQESIQQLSTWCLQHRASHKKVAKKKVVVGPKSDV